MPTLTKPYTFASGGYAVAAQVNADLDTIYNWINGGGAMWNDASVAFTNVPSGPATDPTSGNQLARKSYVDNLANIKVQGNGNFLRLVCGNTVVTPVADGHAAIAITPAFGTQCLGVIAVNGDYGAEPNMVVGAVNVSTSQFDVQCYHNGSPVTGSCRIFWIAFGY